jgi:glycyl-tRNA synthetase beta chain
VILDAAERKETILHEAKQKAFALGLELIEDEGLLEEVAGLAEWPVVLIGKIEDQFMDVPPEILQTSMRTHQKYFSLRDPKTGKMANRFAVVSNMIASDGGKEIVAGNERVLRARLSDAKFFWDQDRKRTLDSRVDDLKNVVFHAKLGTQHERVERIEALAGEIAEKIGADVGKAKRAARLCKADLTTGVVGEFPELQGVMGCYYALHDGQDADVANAVRDHYRPLGPNDAVPTNKISAAVALADKIDQLVGFFSIDERPTGSGDPFALRRAALGVVRILLTTNSRIDLTVFLLTRLSRTMEAGRSIQNASVRNHVFTLMRQVVDPASTDRIREIVLTQSRSDDEKSYWRRAADAVPKGIALRDFILDRLEIILRDRGNSVDVCRAAKMSWEEADPEGIYKGLGSLWVVESEPVVLVARLEARQSFLKTDEGANLLAGYKRAANILKAEEKKDKAVFDGEPDSALFKASEEKALAQALSAAQARIADEIKAERFVEAMGVMAGLRAPVDAFFEGVKVNDDDPKVRENRLKLLSRLRATLHLVADFSKIEG